MSLLGETGMRTFITKMMIVNFGWKFFRTFCLRFNWRCHAWCLMDNHYHIVIERLKVIFRKACDNLMAFIHRSLIESMVGVGHVFQGRYKAILIEKDAYLLELSQYVVLNPVGGGVVIRQ